MNTEIMLAAFGTLEWVVIGLVALLIFGRNLPSVARSLGASIVEFKKGLNEIDKAGTTEKLPEKEQEQDKDKQ